MTRPTRARCLRDASAFLSTATSSACRLADSIARARMLLSAISVSAYVGTKRIESTRTKTCTSVWALVNVSGRAVASHWLQV